MNIAYRTLFAGMLSIVFCSTAVAHDRHHRHDDDSSSDYYVSVSRSGHGSWRVGLDYRGVAAYPRRHAEDYVVYGSRYRPPCHHPSHRRPVVHRRGHKHYRHMRHGYRHYVPRGAYRVVYVYD